MNEQTQGLAQQIFVPLVPTRSITIKYTLGKLLITSLNKPGEVCGVARRVGYTGKHSDDLATYRLKIRVAGMKTFTTLPSVFVVDDGIFIDYEEWQRKQPKNGE